MARFGPSLHCNRLVYTKHNCRFIDLIQSTNSSSKQNLHSILPEVKMSAIVKCNIDASKKGKKRIRTTNRALKKQHASSLQFANEARARKRAKLEESPSFVTDTHLLSPEVSTITMSGSSTGTISTGDSHDAQTKKSTRTRQTIGMSGNHFIDDRSRDWRSFGKQTMKDWVESG